MRGVAKMANDQNMLVTAVVNILCLLILQPSIIYFLFRFATADLLGNDLPNRQCADNMLIAFIMQQCIDAAKHLEPMYCCC